MNLSKIPKYPSRCLWGSKWKASALIGRWWILCLLLSHLTWPVLMPSLLTVYSFSSTTPFTLANPEAMARQPQNPTLESRGTDNAEGNTDLMESFVEIPLYKEYCVRKHTHEAKINSSFVNLLYTIYLVMEIAVLSLKPRLESKGNKSFVNATMARNVGIDHEENRPRVQGGKTVSLNRQGLWPQHSRNTTL